MFGGGGGRGRGSCLGKTREDGGFEGAEIRGVVVVGFCGRGGAGADDADEHLEHAFLKKGLVPGHKRRRQENFWYGVDIRGNVHRGELPIRVFVDGLVFFGSEPDIDDGENTSPGCRSVLMVRSNRKKSNPVTSYKEPVMKTRMTPILRRVGNCSCMTATIGRTSMIRSTKTPKLDVMIVRSTDFPISLEYRC